MPTHRSKKRRSPKRRRQILFARLVFAVCCVLLAALQRSGALRSMQTSLS